MNNAISVIIPNRNGQKTIGLCLDALDRSAYDNFEVIVVDDGSSDRSVEIIEKHPCKLIRLSRHSGAARARNIGARNSTGSVLFFTDADCVVLKDTLSLVNASYNRYGPGSVLGGTYTKMPYDNRFFSVFQSIFIHYSETKRSNEPDYIASHAMVIGRDVFEKSGGFDERIRSMIEDVEFSHRLKMAGVQLQMVPDLEVNHFFDFSLMKSLRNAYTKSKYWTIYSMKNGDIFSDSGTASHELKLNVFLHVLAVISLMTGMMIGKSAFLYGALLLFITNIIINRHFLGFLYRARGSLFTLLSGFYYFAVYPLPVGFGALAGNLQYVMRYIQGGAERS